MDNLSNLITIDARRSIGTLVAEATLKEVSTDELTISEHPVEAGSSIVDHAYKKPAQVVIECGWSNSNLKALAGIKAAHTTLSSGDAFGPDYVSAIYNQLLALQESREPFDVYTGKRAYRSMLMSSLVLTTDVKTEHALMVTVTCRQIMITHTQSTTLPPRENQADPAATSETANSGTRQVATAYPAPGGSWTPPG
jgi:hypothetical protein